MDTDAFEEALKEQWAKIDGPLADEPDTPAEDAPAAPVAPPALEQEPEPTVETPKERTPEGEPETPSPDQVEADRIAAGEAADQAEQELPADASAEEIAAAREQAATDFYVGRYRTREDAEKGLTEKDATIERLHIERAKMRQELEEARQEQPEPGTFDLDVPQWEQWAEQQIAAGAGEQAALQAMGTGGYQAYEIVLRQWMQATDEEGEPDARARADAVIFNNAMQIELVRAEAAKAAAPVIDDQRERVRRDEAEDAQAIARQSFPDWDELEPAMGKALEQMPASEREWLRGLAEGDVDNKVAALRYVANATRGLSAGDRAKAQIEADRQARASADLAIVGATVATPEARVTRTPPPEAEQRAEAYKADIVREMGLEGKTLQNP